MESEVVRLNDGIEIMDTPELSVLKLEGSWTVNRAHELKQVLLEALKNGDGFVLELEALGEADLSFLQLLCSTHRASLRLGKTMILHEKKSKSFKQLANDAGFKRNLGCHRDPRLGCLWIGEWESWTEQS
jgi:anti-anti-sigma regulatory factor